MQSAIAQDVLHRLSQLSIEKAVQLSRWQEIAEYLQPERADFFGVRASAKDDRLKIFDSTPEDALQILAAALHSLLTPSVHAWLNMALITKEEDADDEIKNWLDDVKRLMMAKFNSEDSGFHSAVHEFYLDLPAFGTAGFFVDTYKDQLRFSCIPLSEISISENHLGRIDTIYRKFPMTARQIFERWGKDCSDPVKESNEKNPDQKFHIIHAIYPRELKNIKKKKVIKATEMAYASCYIEEASSHVLSESGYEEMPMMVPRWSKISGESYGRGLGQRSLPDIRVLNEMNRSLLIAGERQADPAMLLPHDGFLGEFNSDGGSTNYYRSTGDIRERVMMLTSEADLNAMLNLIQQRQDSIRKMFLNDKLQMVGGPQMTATEVLVTKDEKFRILGPVLGRMQSEFLAPLINRVFNIMLRSGELPAPPESLQGQDIKVEYVSPISRAQKQTEAESFTQAMTYLGPLFAVAPEMRKNFDFNLVARDTVELFGYPNKYVKSPDVMKKEAAAEAEAMKKQQQEQEAMKTLMLAKEAKGLQSNGESGQ